MVRRPERHLARMRLLGELVLVVQLYSVCAIYCGTSNDHHALVPGQRDPHEHHHLNARLHPTSSRWTVFSGLLACGYGCCVLFSLGGLAYGQHAGLLSRALHAAF